VVCGFSVIVVFNVLLTTSLYVEVFDLDMSEVFELVPWGVSWLSSIIGDGGLSYVFFVLGFKSFVFEVSELGIMDLGFFY